ncbi:MAG: transglycosylase domain-containing protein [Gemmatimonadota bacterium]
MALFLALAFVWIPWPWGLSSRDPERTALMRQRISEARSAGDTLAIRHDWVPLDQISPNLGRAVILAEDQRFPEHDGVDWHALAEEVQWEGREIFSWTHPGDLVALASALRYAWDHLEEIRGRSTITQQLAKNLYFGTDRSLLRKGMELVVARRLEMTLGKDRILELYLNIAEWGPGIFGAEAASRAYFGRGADALTLEQAAALAATLPHPLTSNPARAPAEMRWRQSIILDRMRPQAPAPPEPPPAIPAPISPILP